MFSIEAWEKENEKNHYIEKAILKAISDGAATTGEIVAAAYEAILKKNYENVSPYVLRLHLLRLLKRDDCIRKESATSYVLTPEGREFLRSPLSQNELAANYVCSLINKARKEGKA